MATDIRSKRMLKERLALEKETTEYVCFFDDNDMFNYFCYLVGPADSVYRHKLIKLRFEIPPRYPFVPPKVKFVQHRGQRIHPNLYVDGKLCLSILGTWAGEPWAFSMTTDSVLRTVQSLLDNSPYLHEPHQKDHPEFNDFVRYSTWRWLLLDYLENEPHPAAKTWLQTYLVKNADAMISELHRQQAMATQGAQLVFNSPYQRAEVTADYPVLLRDLNNAIHISKITNVAVTSADGTVPPLPVSERAGPAARGASAPEAAGVGVSQGGLRACEAQPKRRICAEDGADTSQARSQLHTLAAQQAKNPAQQTEGSRRPTQPRAARDFDQLSHAEPPQKRTKTRPEVIDLT